jgi:hypothetical protein
LLFQPGQEGAKGKIECAAHLPQLQDIESPLPRLELGHEGLGTAETISELLLAKTRLGPDLPKQGKKLVAISDGVDTFHALTIGRSNLYPKSG